MPKRVKVADLRQAVLRPQAQARDTYVEPYAKNDSAKYRHLAEALGTTKGVVDAYGTQKKEEDVALGRMLRLKNQLTYAEAVEQGIIPAGGSPWIEKGYKSTAGELNGKHEYAAELNRVLHERQLHAKDFNTPAERTQAMHALVQETREKFLEGRESTDYVDGFMKSAGGAESSIAARFNQMTYQANEEKANIAMQARIEDIFDTAAPQDIPGLIDAFTKEQRGVYGISFQKINANIYKSIESRAEMLAHTGDIQGAFDTLEAMQSIPTSEGNTLGSTTAGQTVTAKVAASIRSISEHNEKFNRWTEVTAQQREDRPYQVAARNFQVRTRQMVQHQRDDALREGIFDDYRSASMGQAMIDLMGNPEDSLGFKRRIDEWMNDPELRAEVPKLMTFRNNFFNAERKVYEDTADVSRFASEVMTGRASMEDVLVKANNGELGRQTTTYLLEKSIRQQELQAAGKNLGPIVLKHLNDSRSDMEQLAKGHPDNYDQGVGFKGAEMVTLYNEHLIEFLQKTPNPTFAEANAFTAQFHETVKKDSRLIEQDDDINYQNRVKQRAASKADATEAHAVYGNKPK